MVVQTSKKFRMHMPNIYSKTGALHSIRVKKQASRVLLYHKFMLFFLGGRSVAIGTGKISGKN